MTREEILELLSDCINEADLHGLMNIGDDLMIVIGYLRDEWNMGDEEEKK